MAFQALMPLKMQTSMSSRSSHPPVKPNMLFSPLWNLKSYPTIPDYDPPIPSFFLFFTLLNLPRLLKENIGIRLFVCLSVFFPEDPWDTKNMVTPLTAGHWLRDRKSLQFSLVLGRKRSWNGNCFFFIHSCFLLLTRTNRIYISKE